MQKLLHYVAVYTFACYIIASVCFMAAVSGDQTQQSPSKQSNSTPTIAELAQKLKALDTKLKQIMDDRILLLQGRDGRDGRDGQPGPKGPRGVRGKKGAQGPKGDRSGGVQYVRWGRTTCPSSAQLVYEGIVAGEHYTHTGGGVNYLCMTKKPVYNKSKSGNQYGGLLYSAEYELPFNPFTKPLQDHNVPCAVCYVSNRSTKLMIPGTNACPAGWTQDYHGYLMTEHYTHKHPRDFICMDKYPEAIAGSQANTNGALLYPVEGTCGSGGLPCAPYVSGYEITCAVCSK